MRKLILIFICLVFAGYCSMSFAEDNNSVKTALLRQLSKTQPGDTLRLNILYQLKRISDNSQVEAYYCNKLLQEAEAMNNSKYLCKAYLGFMTLAYNDFDPVKVNYWMKLLEPIARKKQLYDDLFLGKRCVVDMYQVTEEYEREEREAEKMLQEAKKLNNSVGIIAAYQCLANVYRVAFRTKEAVGVLNKAYEVAVKFDDSFVIEITKSLIATYQELDDLPNRLHWTKIQDEYLNKKLKDNPSSASLWRGWLMMTYISYLSYYIEMENWTQAEKYLYLAEQHNMSGYGTFSYNYYWARYDYFRKTEQLDKALIELEQFINITKEISLRPYIASNFSKAKLLYDLNRYDDALTCYKQSFAIKDSIEIALLNKQTEQVKKDYNADVLLLEKEKIGRNTQLVFLVLAIVILFVLIAFVIHTYRVRVHLKKSENEMRRMAEEMEQAHIAKERFLSTISTAISVPMNEVVNGSMALAADIVTDEEERKVMSASINKTSTKLMELINNILDLSRLEAGMMKFREEDINLLLVFRELIDALPEDIRKRLTISLPEGNSCMVRVDVARLQEIFNNLILTSPGNLSLIIDCVEHEQTVRICITGSLLSSGEQSQEISIANEVNRLLIEHFGGHYEVRLNDAPASVCFVLPLLKA